MRESCYLLPVPLSEALALPIMVERETYRSLTQNMCTYAKGTTHVPTWRIIHSTGLYRLLILDHDMKFARFLTVKKER